MSAITALDLLVRRMEHNANTAAANDTAVVAVRSLFQIGLSEFCEGQQVTSTEVRDAIKLVDALLCRVVKENSLKEQMNTLAGMRTMTTPANERISLDALATVYPTAEDRLALPAELHRKLNYHTNEEAVEESFEDKLIDVLGALGVKFEE